MTKVKIAGYSLNEGSRVFEILDREEIEEIIDTLSPAEIYRQTFEKAQRYSFSGDAYTYADARNGEIKTRWMQLNTFDHPWDAFYEIVLCSIKTPVEPLSDEDLINWDDKDEVQAWKEVYPSISAEDFILERYGQKELDDRIENCIWFYASEFDFDDDSIKEQLDRLYQKVVILRHTYHM